MSCGINYTAILMDLPGEIWALLGTIGSGLLAALGIVWKLYLKEKDEKESQAERFNEKRHVDGLKLVEMLLKVQTLYESVIKVSTKIDGMISIDEKRELINAFNRVRADIESIANKVNNE